MSGVEGIGAATDPLVLLAEMIEKRNAFLKSGRNMDGYLEPLYSLFELSPAALTAQAAANAELRGEVEKLREALVLSQSWIDGPHNVIPKHLFRSPVTLLVAHTDFKAKVLAFIAAALAPTVKP